MYEKVSVDFEVVVSHTIADKITMVIQPVHAPRTVPTVIVSGWFGHLAHHTLL